MPNYCNYDMKIKGSKSAISRVVKCLRADYNYGERKPTHKHFFRVFDCYENEDDLQKNEDGTFTKYVFGCCAWSVYSCMLDNEDTYYNSIKKSYPNIFMGTSLKEQSKDCEIEVFSEETGMCFSEHYLFKNGQCLIDESTDISLGGYDDKGRPTKDIEEDYDGDIIIFNPNRTGIDEPYLWEIE